jgi:hypothetical protein
VASWHDAAHLAVALCIGVRVCFGIAVTFGVAVSFSFDVPGTVPFADRDRHANPYCDRVADAERVPDSDVYAVFGSAGAVVGFA